MDGWIALGIEYFGFGRELADGTNSHKARPNHQFARALFRAK